MKSVIDQYVIDKVKERRTELGISQARLANELNVSISFIGMAESSKYKTHYNLQHLNQLAVILDCSPHYFLPVEPLL